MFQPRCQNLSESISHFGKMTIAVVVAALLAFGSSFVVDCVAIEDDHESRIAKIYHEDLSAPQKHSTYVDHDSHHEDSHVHIYQVDAKVVLESFNNLFAGYDGESFYFAKASITPKQIDLANAAQRTYFARQQTMLPKQYKSHIHPHVVILV